VPYLEPFDGQVAELVQILDPGHEELDIGGIDTGHPQQKGLPDERATMSVVATPAGLDV
jgi:hypothetical protein